MGNIIIHSEFGKKLIELTEDELIIRRFLHRKKIKRSNIKSAYMLDNSLNVLTYNNKIIIANYISIKWSERDNIKRIIDEINKEDIIFNITRGNFHLGLLLCCFSSSLINLLRDALNKNYFSLILLIALIGIIFIAYIKRVTNKGINYSISDRKFNWVRKLGKTTTNYPIEDIKLIKDDEALLKCKFNNEKDTFNIVKKIDYPLSYKFALEEIGSISKGSLKKL